MQESGIIEIIPLICISAIWGQYPELSHNESLQGAHWRLGGGGGGGRSTWLLDGGHPVSILTYLRAHLQGICNVKAW